MSQFSGSDLREVFKTLGINTGNVSDLTIDSWFDTDCEDTKEFLNWMCSSLSSENALTSSELNEYEQAVEKNTLLSGKQYEAELNRLKLNYPGILNYETNVFELECMEDDLITLLEEEKHLERVLNVNENLAKILSRELADKKEEEVLLGIERKGAEEKCMNLSGQLDNVHMKLQQQISRCAENINKYDIAARPLFLSSFPLSQYEQYYTDIESYVNLLLKGERKLDTGVKSARKKLLATNDGEVCVKVDELETLRERIFRSTYRYVRKQIEKDMLLAQIRFLEEADWKAMPKDESLEMNNILKSELVDRMFIDLENVCRELSNSIIEKPKLLSTLNTVETNQQKLNSLMKINDITIKILSFVILLHLLIDIEKVDVQSTNKLFKDIHHYINNNLNNCELRIKSMNEIIQNYNLYQKLSLDEKLNFTSVIKSLLTDKSENTLTVDVIKRFSNHFDSLLQQVFGNQSNVHREYCQSFEEDLKLIHRFLTGGPTSHIITFPHKILDTFGSIFSILDSQNAELLSTLQVISDAKNKLSKNKWLKMKRLLPMWFHFKPTKMVLAIGEIEAEVMKRQNQNVENTTTSV